MEKDFQDFGRWIPVVFVLFSLLEFAIYWLLGLKMICLLCDCIFFTLWFFTASYWNEMTMKKEVENSFEFKFATIEDKDRRPYIYVEVSNIQGVAADIQRFWAIIEGAELEEESDEDEDLETESEDSEEDSVKDSESAPLNPGLLEEDSYPELVLPGLLEDSESAPLNPGLLEEDSYPELFLLPGLLEDSDPAPLIPRLLEEDSDPAPLIPGRQEKDSDPALELPGRLDDDSDPALELPGRLEVDRDQGVVDIPGHPNFNDDIEVPDELVEMVRARFRYRCYHDELVDMRNWVII